MDRFLASLPDAPSRTQVAEAIAAGDVRVGARAVKASMRLRAGERIRATWTQPDAAETDIEAEPIPLAVLYADDEIAVVDKPAGMVVHPAAGHWRGTLVNALLHHYGGRLLPGGAARAGIVHRLDRDTSGVIVVALTRTAHEALARQFRERTVVKRYLALVRGRVEGEGTIEAAIGRHPRDRKRMSTVTRKARPARTRFRFVRRLGPATLLEIEPETGRTHQIRVHLATRGWPIVGDPVYGKASSRTWDALKRQWPASTAVLRRFPRQALHARELVVSHPRDNRRLSFESPLPPDFARLLRELEAASRRDRHSG